jgi:hypothetical protein
MNRGVTKLKPASTPRIFDEHTAENHERTKKNIQQSKSAIMRSQNLRKEAKKILATMKDWHGE